jgi:hypothetical protein
MQKINKLKAQIFAINKQIKEGKVKNIIPAQNKIKSLQMALKIELEQQYWRNLESI